MPEPDEVKAGPDDNLDLSAAPKELGGGDAADKKKRKRAKRPGSKRTSADKRKARKGAKGDGDGDKDKDEKEGGEEQKAGAPAKKRKKEKKDGDGADGEEKDDAADENGDEDDPADMDNRVFVKGLPLSTAEKSVSKLFNRHGTVKSVRFVRNSRGVFSGSGFVVFADAEGAEKALDLDGGEWRDKILAVKKAAPPVKQHTCVYIGGLHYEAPEATLKKDFGECGEIVKFKMIKDKANLKFKGAVFITYANQSGVDAALKFDGTEYSERQITVSLSTPKGMPGPSNAKSNQSGKEDGKGKGKGKDGKGKAKGKGKGKDKGKGKGKVVKGGGRGSKGGNFE